MFNAITELFLSEYFILTASAGKFVADRKDLFLRLADVFLIDKPLAEKLFALSEDESVLDVVTEQDYLRHQRMQSYAELTGGKAALNSDVAEIIRVKGNALISATQQKLTLNPHNSRNAEYSQLVNAANGGLITALKILGFLQCEGIFLDKNVKAGVKHFVKAANWNDCAGTLYLLRYCSVDRAYNLSRLKITVTGTPFESLYGQACEVYSASAAFDVPEVCLLERAFASAILSRSVYNPMSARILYGDVLSLKDKERAMFSSDAGKLAGLSDLPLKLSGKRIAAVDANGVSNVALTRLDEQRKIAAGLNNADLRAYGQYRPLCLAGDSPYVLNMYARAIASLSDGCRYEVINVADLSGYDLEPSANNVFVRNIDEDADNRFLLFFAGSVPDKTLDFVKNFLISSRRAKFHLNSPNVTLNLSSVLPICFCDKRNARLLEDLTDAVRLADVSADELPKAVADIISNINALYGVELTLGGTVGEVFGSCAVDKVERIVDVVARAHRCDGKKFAISRAVVDEYSQETDVKRIGFGA